jgi:hypothetical protein
MKEKQMEDNNVQNSFEKREAEKDPLMRAMITGGRFEVECVKCGETVIVTWEGRSHNTEDRWEHVKDNIFRLKGDPTQALYREVPTLCRGCGLEWSGETLRLKDTN